MNAAIRETFFQECEEQLGELEVGLNAMDEGVADSETVNAVFRAVHSIKGGAGAEQFEARLGSSTHGFGIAEAFRLGQITKNVPEEAIVYGIEAASFEWGAGLSGEVHAAVQRWHTKPRKHLTTARRASWPRASRAGEYRHGRQRSSENCLRFAANCIS